MEQTSTRDVRRTWIFQANPTRYRILDSLRMEASELWNLNQHSQDIRVEDRVVLWVSGRSAGIYAVGTVASPAFNVPDTSEGQQYWIDTEAGRRAKPRVLVEYHTLLHERPLLKAFLQWDPDLEDLSVLRQPRGTNFPVSLHEWRAIKRWLGEDVRPEPII